MLDSFLTWLILGFFVSLFIRLTYAAPGKNSFGNSMFLGAMGAASGEAMSKLFSFGSNMTVSPMLYMLVGSAALIIWSLNNRIAH